MKGNIAASLRDIVSGCSPLFLHCCYKKYKSTTCYRTLITILKCYILMLINLKITVVYANILKI